MKVLIVGAGLIGSSIALALKDAYKDNSNLKIYLDDINKDALKIALDFIGASAIDLNIEPDIVFVATPPSPAPKLIAQYLEKYRSALVVDIASVKTSIIEGVLGYIDFDSEINAQQFGRKGFTDDIIGIGGDKIFQQNQGALLEKDINAFKISISNLVRYIPSHPMAGRELQGALAGRSDLFYGVIWAICPLGRFLNDIFGFDDDLPKNNISAFGAFDIEQHKKNIAFFKDLVKKIGASPVEIDSQTHDNCVADISHIPYILSCSFGAFIKNISEQKNGDTAIKLSAGGAKDMSRLALSDTALWSDILLNNSLRIDQALNEYIQVLSQIKDIMAQAGHITNGEKKALTNLKVELEGLLEKSSEGAILCQKKHGKNYNLKKVVVFLQDKKGQLKKLFDNIENINIEDIRLEHSASKSSGYAELYINPEDYNGLIDILKLNKWKIY